MLLLPKKIESEDELDRHHPGTKLTPISVSQTKAFSRTWLPDARECVVFKKSVFSFCPNSVLELQSLFAEDLVRNWGQSWVIDQNSTYLCSVWQLQTVNTWLAFVSIHSLPSVCAWPILLLGGHSRCNVLYKLAHRLFMNLPVTLTHPQQLPSPFCAHVELGFSRVFSCETLSSCCFYIWRVGPCQFWNARWAALLLLGTQFRSRQPPALEKPAWRSVPCGS